ncbi:fcbe58fe-4f70-479d-8ada-daff5b887913 [Sclerotinia trifoliorum]|uniref:Mediator of RNA polymerase II transcription subunit 14 n=1 Tax=Sclerotinia trifoliorum TaxID=28548 RepID=A0A8H2ZVP5_9HELO|nr:fcbe58fe-4f70-479d-8ada-daff5b887913 [Sclerotinia trifoliorum]
MPGIIMDSGSRNGSHTNHDRDRHSNGTNGEAKASEKGRDKNQARSEPQQNMTPISRAVPNGMNGNLTDGPARQQNSGEDPIPKDILDRIHDLPPEVEHITFNFLSLTELLNRLAQSTHNELRQEITKLANMPTPQSAINGSPSHITKEDDTSNDNVNKKVSLLDFAQTQHSRWVKQLVLLDWSRKADQVSKIIDLNVHLIHKRGLYNLILAHVGDVKKKLCDIDSPSPDLKTAVEVLSTGKANWMPDLGYIAPPPMTSKEILKSLEKLNTLLSIRLNLHEYDKLPLQFKDYTIKSGRVTFKVAGEFEIDLTIADEDQESQFWFIDFRFLFSPSLRELPPRHQFHIESKVNAALEKDGLSGCYTYLHEMVLTHKISEFRRQAVELSRSTWIDGVKVEPLHRALCIQYWLDRYKKNGPRSWIIIGVHSGRRKDGYHDPRTTSRLFIRWFRDSKEVKDVDIPLDAVNISAEQLLKTVIAMHVNHILRSTHNKLAAEPIFANREASLSLHTSKTEPKESVLGVQLTEKQHVSITIEPVTGIFIFSPASRIITSSQNKLNSLDRDPATDAHYNIENLRCLAISEELVILGTSVGWRRADNPGISREDLKRKIPKDTKQINWFRRPGWQENWLVAVTLGMSGESWWLFQTSKQSTGVKVLTSIHIPIKAVSPTPSYVFMSTLHIFAGGLISQYTNLKALHDRRIHHTIRQTGLPSPVKLPSIWIHISELFSARAKPAAQKTWAKDFLKLTFQGLEPLPALSSLPPQSPADDPQATSHKLEQKAVLVTVARMAVPIPALSVLNEKIDKDIAFKAQTGEIAFRLRSQVGESIIPSLTERLFQIERLISCTAVLRKHEKFIKCDTISLQEITFSYGMPPAAETGSDMGADKAKARSYKAVVSLGLVEGKMKLTLETGNPHIRVLDALDKVLNIPKGGFDAVTTLLPQTLYCLRAFETIEDAWAPLHDRGEVFIFVRAFEWFNLRYILKSSTPDTPPRKVSFEIKMCHRKQKPWWLVRRTEKTERGGKGEVLPDDGIDACLKSVWDSPGDDDWKGMRTSAVGRNRGIETCLEKVDAVIRNLSPEDLTFQPSQQSQPRTQAQAIGSQGQQSSHIQQQRKLQLPTPANSQNHPQSQGSSQGHQRMPAPNMNMNMNMNLNINQNMLKRKSSNQGINPRTAKREVVEID